MDRGGGSGQARLLLVGDTRDVIRVLSWNVTGRVDLAQERQLAAVLGREPTIIALQEVIVRSYRQWSCGLLEAGYSVLSSIDFVSLSYPPPPYRHPPFPRSAGRGGQIKRKYFNLLASRHPIAALPGLVFQDHDEAALAFPEKYLAARVHDRSTGLAVDIHNAHLPPGVSRGLIKVHAFEAIRRRVDLSAGNPTVLCGDFNAPLTEDEDGPVVTQGTDWSAPIPARWCDAETSVIANPSMRDVYRDVRAAGSPFPASHFTAGTPRRYAYVFASPELQTDSCAYELGWFERDRDGSRLSDHAAVRADLSHH